VGFIVLGIIILHLMKYPKIIRKNLDYLIFTSAGGFLQLMVILNSSENRASLTDFELILKNSFNYLIKSLISIFYYRQDLRLDDPIFLQQKFVSFMYSYHYIFIVLFILILLVPILSRNNKYSKVLPLIIIFFSNLVTLIISSYTLGWPYRFLVLNSTLIFWIIICFTDLILPKKVSLVLKINLVLLVTYNLLFNFGVTKYRVEGPNWSSEVKSKKVECINDKYEKEIFITFNPNWPTKNPHVHGLVEPTTNKISCQDFFNFSSR
jgi:hypothetical protein